VKYFEKFSSHNLTQPEEETEDRLACRAVEMDDSSYCSCGSCAYVNGETVQTRNLPG
jgi:hypothetical protein